MEEFIPDARVDRKRHLIHREDVTTQVAVYPLSINVSEVQRIANSPRALEHEEKLLSMKSGTSAIVRIDRAEPNKNVVRGFRAFELLLSRYPDLRGKVNFLAFLVPSRTHIRQYQRYMEEIQQMVSPDKRQVRYRGLATRYYVHGEQLHPGHSRDEALRRSAG